MFSHRLLMLSASGVSLSLASVVSANLYHIGSTFERSAVDFPYNPDQTGQLVTPGGPSLFPDGVMDGYWSDHPSAVNWSELGEIRGQVYFDLDALSATGDDVISASLIYSAEEVTDYQYFDAIANGFTDGPTPRDVSLSLYGNEWDTNGSSYSDADDAALGDYLGSDLLSATFGNVAPAILGAPQIASFDITQWVKEQLDNGVDGLQFVFVNDTQETAIDPWAGKSFINGPADPLWDPNAPFRIVLDLKNDTPIIPTPSAMGFGALMLAGLAARRKRN